MSREEREARADEFLNVFLDRGLVWLLKGVLVLLGVVLVAQAAIAGVTS